MKLIKIKEKYYLIDVGRIKENSWYLHHSHLTGEYSLFKSDPVYQDGNNPNVIDIRPWVHPYYNFMILASTEQLGGCYMLNENQVINLIPPGDQNNEWCADIELTYDNKRYIPALVNGYVNLQSITKYEK